MSNLKARHIFGKSLKFDEVNKVLSIDLNDFSLMYLNQLPAFLEPYDITQDNLDKYATRILYGLLFKILETHPKSKLIDPIHLESRVSELESRIQVNYGIILNLINTMEKLEEKIIDLEDELDRKQKN